MTLLPGDIIYTGTPGEPPEIKTGDSVEIEVTGAGILRNGVV
jgi:2-keto-4-pentenoate hydratase/2-oxohepta-3-ene-1,7-dioic acid hydratase in catechol pathway